MKKDELTWQEKERLAIIRLTAENLMLRASLAIKHPSDYNCMLVLMRDDLSQIASCLERVSEQEEERIWGAIASIKSREM